LNTAIARCFVFLFVGGVFFFFFVFSLVLLWVGGCLGGVFLFLLVFGEMSVLADERTKLPLFQDKSDSRRS